MSSEKETSEAKKEPVEEDDEEQKKVRQEKVRKRKEEAQKKAEEKKGKESPESSASNKANVSEPIREDLVANSVNFLLHPKVRGSANSKKIEFLQKKGLTQAEIQEAFSRANLSNNNSAVSAPSNSSNGVQKSYSNPNRQNEMMIGNQGNMYNQPPMQYPSQQLVVHQPQQPSWLPSGKLGLFLTSATSVLIGFVIAFAAKKFLVPLIWGDPEKIKRKLEMKAEKKRQKEEEKRNNQRLFEDLNNTMKSIQLQNNQLKEIITKTNEENSKQKPIDGILKSSLNEISSELKSVKAMVVDQRTTSSTNLNPLANSWGPTLTNAPNPSSLTSSWLNKSSLPSWQLNASSNNNTTSNNTNAPVPSIINTQFSSSSTNLTASATTNATNNKTSNILVDENSNSAPKSTQPEITSPSNTAKHPKDFLAITEMIKRGETPPDVNLNINDKPENPNQVIEQGKKEAPPKPWSKTKAVSFSNAPTTNSNNVISENISASSQPSTTTETKEKNPDLN